ncbi:5-formyltetrahydrofolate cyclo-ligase [Candidatus Pelagibacter sp.]|nr:5-formyltetrahydrofolate cyclo-ligase [Candidatus Pelagibacter sp.]
MNKSAIRKKLISLRKKKYKSNIELNPNKLIELIDKQKLNSKIIGCYYPFNYELDILNILEALVNKKYILSLPKILKNNEMNFFKWSIYDPLEINTYGIPEPISDKKIDPNILLIPLVGFDNKLNRLGYGGGYYDRYLSKVKLYKTVLKIGVGFSFQKVKNLPINKYDQKLDYIITEKKII